MLSKKKKLCRFNYKKEDVPLALEDIAKGKSIAETARKFGIPESTLRAKKLNLYADKKPGPSTVLTQEEENGLIKWIFHCSDRGFPVSKVQLLESVRVICVNSKRNNPFTNNTPGRSWYEGFMKRHPEITKRVSENVNLSRAKVTEYGLRNWFKEIATYIVDENIATIEPERIFNCDETGISLNPASSTVIAPKGSRNVYKIVNNNEKTSITVLVTCSALGELAPTFVIFSGKSVPKKVFDVAPSDFVFGYSDNGWMLAQTFFEYLANVFEPWLTKQKLKRPVILYVDGHSSHVTLHCSEFCSAHEIILVALHPNATHIIQPLDVSFFRTLKSHWVKTCEEFNKSTMTIGIQKHQLAPLLERTFKSMDIQKICKSGFKKCGLYPLDANAIDYSKVLRMSQHHTCNSSEEKVENATNKSELVQFENFLSEEQIESFKLNKSPVWQGLPKEESLYNIWYKITNSCNGVPANIIEENFMLVTDNLNDVDHSTEVNFDSPEALENCSNTSQLKHDFQFEKVIECAIVNESDIAFNVQDLNVLSCDENLRLPSNSNVQTKNCDLESTSSFNVDSSSSMHDVNVLANCNGFDEQSTNDFRIDNSNLILDLDTNSLIVNTTNYCESSNELVLPSNGTSQNSCTQDSNVSAITCDKAASNIDTSCTLLVKDSLIDLPSKSAFKVASDSNVCNEVKNMVSNNNSCMQESNECEITLNKVVADKDASCTLLVKDSPIDLSSKSALKVAADSNICSNIKKVDTTESSQKIIKSFKENKIKVPIKTEKCELKKNPLYDSTNSSQAASVGEFGKYLFWPDEKLLKGKNKRKSNKINTPSILSGKMFQSIKKERENEIKIKLETVKEKKEVRFKKQEETKIKKEADKIKKEEAKKKRRDEILLKEQQKIDRQKIKLEKAMKKLEDKIKVEPM